MVGAVTTALRSPPEASGSDRPHGAGFAPHDRAESPKHNPPFLLRNADNCTRKWGT